MSEDWLSRTELLIGNENIERLKNAHVAVFGLGGVGAYAAEQLCRAGIGTLTIIDGDIVNDSNRNRQLLATVTNKGKYKANVMAVRLKDINPDLKLHVYPIYVKDEIMVEILDSNKYDFVVDAIDTLSPKIYLLYHCVKRNYPVVSSMGSGGKFDPAKIEIADIAQTFMCPLADVLRKRLHKLNVYSGIYAVFTPEKPLGKTIINQDEPNKKSTVGTISYMPAIFGCTCASVVIRILLGEKIISTLKIPKKIINKIEKSNLNSNI